MVESYTLDLVGLNFWVFVPHHWFVPNELGTVPEAGSEAMEEKQEEVAPVMAFLNISCLYLVDFCCRSSLICAKHGFEWVNLPEKHKFEALQVSCMKALLWKGV